MRVELVFRCVGVDMLMTCKFGTALAAWDGREDCRGKGNRGFRTEASSQRYITFETRERMKRVMIKEGFYCFYIIYRLQSYVRRKARNRYLYAVAEKSRCGSYLTVPYLTEYNSRSSYKKF